MAIAISLIVGLALFIRVVFTGVIKYALPVFTGGLGFSPTIVSSPFVAAVVSTLSLLVCFNLTATVLRVWTPTRGRGARRGGTERFHAGSRIPLLCSTVGGETHLIGGRTPGVVFSCLDLFFFTFSFGFSTLSSFLSEVTVTSFSVNAEVVEFVVIVEPVPASPESRAVICTYGPPAGDVADTDALCTI